MCGGSGRRLWPLSTRERPKPLLSLGSRRSLLEETLERVRGDGFAAPTLICGVDHASSVRQQAADAAMLVEPVPRGTAPAVAAACRLLPDDALALVAPADHIVRDRSAFERAVAAGAQAARNGSIVTFGVVPDRPATGFGWIERGEPHQDAPGVHAITAFVEKPDFATASQYLDRGDMLWNAGMFLFEVATMRAELARHAPTVAVAAFAAVDAKRQDVLDEVSFSRSPHISIDVAVMERTDRAAVVPLDAGWSDVGSYASLMEQGTDASGNAQCGDARLVDVRGSFVHTEAQPVVVCGVSDVAVVVTEHGVLVTALDQAERVGKWDVQDGS